MFIDNLFNRDLWVHDVIGRDRYNDVTHEEEPRYIIDAYVQRERVHYLNKNNNIEYRTMLTIYLKKDEGVVEHALIEIVDETMMYSVTDIEKVHLPNIGDVTLNEYYKITALAVRKKDVGFDVH